MCLKCLTAMSAKGHAQMIAVVCQSIVVCYNTWVQLSLRTSSTSHKLIESPGGPAFPGAAEKSKPPPSLAAAWLAVARAGRGGAGDCATPDPQTVPTDSEHKFTT